MKKITLSLLFCIGFYISNAQYLNEGFETSVPPTGWIDVAGSGLDNGDLWAQNSAQSNGGANSAWFDDFSGDHDRWLISPALNLSAGTSPELTFAEFILFPSFTVTNEVLYSTDYTGSGDPTLATWTSLNLNTNSAAWTTLGPFALPTSATVYVAFHYVGNFANEWFIDDVVVQEPPSCLAPTGLVATPTSTTEVDFTWTAGDTETMWTYEYGVSPYAQGGGGTSGTVMTTPALSLTGLTAGETYDIYVQANCGGANGDSSYINVQWTQPNVGEVCGEPFVATVESDCSVATPITLDFDSGGTETLTSCDASGNTGYWVSFVPTATGAVTLNVTGATNLGATIYDSCGGSEVFCNNNTLPASTEIAGLTPSATYYTYFWLDTPSGMIDVCFEEFTPPAAPDCAETPISPTDAAIDVVVTGGEVTLSWTAPSSGPAPTDYQIFFGETSGALTNLGLTGSTATTQAITGIDFSTTYYWRIVPYNGATPATGPCAEWSFTTEAAPPPPANDDASGAVSLTPTLAFEDGPLAGQSNLNATASEVADPSIPAPGCAAYSGEDVWYSVVVPNDGNIILEADADPTGSGGDAGGAAYSGTPGALVLISCNDDGGPGLYPQVIVSDPTLAGQTIYFRVWGWNGANLSSFRVAAYSATLSADILEQDSAFSYYPNPVKNTLTLNAQNNIENVRMYNMLGQEVMQIQPQTVDSELDMSGLETGTYFVQVTIANVTKTVRVVKQ